MLSMLHLVYKSSILASRFTHVGLAQRDPLSEATTKYTMKEWEKWDQTLTYRHGKVPR